MPRERIELSWITPHDFESCASANSATAAFYNLTESRNIILSVLFPLVDFKYASRRTASSLLKCASANSATAAINILYNKAVFTAIFPAPPALRALHKRFVW